MVNVKIVYYVTKTCSTAVIKQKQKNMVKLTDKDETKQNKTTITKPPTAAKCVCCKYENGIFCECAILFPGWLRIGLERLELGDGITTVTGPGGQ